MIKVNYGYLWTITMKLTTEWFKSKHVHGLEWSSQHAALNKICFRTWRLMFTHAPCVRENNFTHLNK